MKERRTGGAKMKDFLISSRDWPRDNELIFY
jgi:hypothetical protein